MDIYRWMYTFNACVIILKVLATYLIYYKAGNAQIIFKKGVIKLNFNPADC